MLLHFYSIILLSLLFICLKSTNVQHKYLNRTIVPSRTIYDLIQMRRVAAKFSALRNRTHRNMTTNNFRQSTINIVKVDNNDNIDVDQDEISNFRKNYNRFLNERLKAIIIISTVALALMILIVTVCIIVKCHQEKSSIITITSEQIKPLNSPTLRNTSMAYSYSNCDRKNFSRKPRTLPARI